MTHSISVIPGQCEFIPDFLQSDEASDYFRRIYHKAHWRQQTVTLFNKDYASPRLSAWHGNKKAVYRYSGAENHPRPWFDELSALREKVEAHTQCLFNSVLLNLYRDERDGMGAHSDDEKELGDRPVIASLSFGAVRRFILHPKQREFGESIKINLTHGSLLVMSGLCQRHWKHSVPKTRSPRGPRMNLTFRRVAAH